MKDKVVISLTSIPPRFRGIGETINCILNQDFIPDEIQVYIPKTYRRFPQHSFTLPEIPLGGGRVVVKVVEADLGPATKVLYCAKNFWGTNTRIIYCDDDCLPENTWLTSFIQATNKMPESAIVSRGLHLKSLGFGKISNKRFPRAVKFKKRFAENFGYVSKRIQQKVKEEIFRRPFQKPQKSGLLKFKQSGYVDIAEGCGGVSISPEFFDCSSFDIPEVIWTADDIWLSGKLENRKIGIWLDNSIRIPQNSSSSRVEDLYNYSTEGFDRKLAYKFGVKYFQDNYSIWK